MKQIAPNYTYNKTTGVITLTGVNIDRDQLLLIVNTTRNVTYYNFADSATTLQAFTQGANTSLTLNSSVITASSAHANGDALTIYYDDQANSVTANGGDFTALAGDTDPARSVQIGFKDAATTGDFVTVNNDARQFPVKAYGVDYQGNSLGIPVEIDSNTIGEKLIPIGFNASGDARQVSDAYPLPISGTVTANVPYVSSQPANQSEAIPVVLITDEGKSVFDVGQSIKASIQNSIPAGTNLIGSVTATDLGAKADAVASTDTGTFSVIALIKRGLQNWTSLLAKIPTLVSGRIPVDGSGVTQPVSLASVPSHAVTGTFWQTTQPVSLDSVPTHGVTGTFWQTTQPVSIALSTTPAVTTFTSTSSATLIASNTSRKMLTIQNTGAGILYVLFGTGTASSTNFSLQMNSGDFYENNYYSGQVNAIFATAGTAYVTSLT